VSSKEQPFKWLLRSETNWLAYESSSTNVAVGVQNWGRLLSAVNQTVVYAYVTNGRFFRHQSATSDPLYSPVKLSAHVQRAKR